MENLTLVSEVKVSFEPPYTMRNRPTVSSSKDAYKILIDRWDKGLIQFLEEFKILLLSTANRVLGIAEISLGGRDYTPVDMKTIFSIALKSSARKIILVHNHPSGKLIPSSSDLALTKKAVTAGKVLDIEICDHIIVGIDGYYSLKDAGDF